MPAKPNGESAETLDEALARAAAAAQKLRAILIVREANARLDALLVRRYDREAT